jgi:hypothetical protein
MSVVASLSSQGHSLQSAAPSNQQQSDRDAVFRRYKDSLRDTMLRGIIDEKQVHHPLLPPPYRSVDLIAASGF